MAESDIEAELTKAEEQLGGLQSQLSLLESGTTGAALLKDLKDLRRTVSADTDAGLKLSAERVALSAECEKMETDNAKLENQIKHLQR